MRKMKSEALRPAASAGVPGLTVLTFNIKVMRVESVTFCYPFHSKSFTKVAILHTYKYHKILCIALEPHHQFFKVF